MFQPDTMDTVMPSEVQDVHIHTRILDNLGMGVLYCDIDGIIRYVNDSYAKYIGKPAEDIEGHEISKIIPATRAHQVMASGEAEMCDVCSLAKSSRGKSLVVNRLPIRNAAGKVIGMTSQAIFHDSAELKKVHNKIAKLESEIDDYQQRIKASLSSRHTLESIQGESPQIVNVRKQVKSYGRLDAPVLVLGPTGGGKELIAHALHAESPRSEGPIVFINCAAIPENLFESELFGYAKGAFSGANQKGKMGQIELANGGTLFLDEIGDMPLMAQAKLLRVLESKTICRVGDVVCRPVDFRLISATNQDIESMVQAGSFREDLYYRINTFVIDVPSLAERAGDIIILAEHFLHRMGNNSARFTEDAKQALRSYHWPGNIRELHNVVVHAFSIRKSDDIDFDDMPECIKAAQRRQAQRQGDVDTVSLSTRGGGLSENMADLESKLIQKALKEHNGNILKTANALNVSRATLYDKMKKLKIER